MEHSWMTLFLFICVLSFSEAKPSLDIICKKEGRIVDADSCISYYNCVLPADKKLQAVHRTCPKGHGFSPSLLSCVPIEEVDGCHRRTSRSRMDVRNEQHDSFCESADSSFVCADCKTEVMCINREAYDNRCQKDEFCKHSESFASSVCHPKPSENCTCTANVHFQKDPYDSSKFFECTNNTVRLGDNDDDFTIYSCQEGMEFNQKHQDCEYSDGSPRCESMGKMAYYEDCSIYYNCLRYSLGFIREKNYCSEGFMFNENKGQCERPCEWTDGSFTCQEEGRFINITDCSSYVVCKTDINGDLRQYSYKCPGDNEWNGAVMGKGGRCVSKEHSTCTPKEITKCIIPDGFCSGDINATENVQPEDEISPIVVLPPSSKDEFSEIVEEFPQYIDVINQYVNESTQTIENAAQNIDSVSETLDETFNPFENIPENSTDETDISQFIPDVPIRFFV